MNDTEAEFDKAVILFFKVLAVAMLFLCLAALALACSLGIAIFVR